VAKESALTDPQIRERLAALPGWRHEGGMIRRSFKTDGWPTTLMLVNAIGYYAEAADHHPDLVVQWGSVQVALATHSAGGITEKDFALAALVERTALWQAGPPFRTAEKFKRTGA
jgi:4a-hydroxytetrahydrobiopterin dehydratase